MSNQTLSSDQSELLSRRADDPKGELTPIETGLAEGAITISIEELFAKDPLTYEGPDFKRIILAMRAARGDWMEEEERAQLMGKKSNPNKGAASIKQLKDELAAANDGTLELDFSSLKI